MSAQPLDAQEFDHRTAGQAEYTAWNTLANRLRWENWPEDPPSSAERTAESMRGEPDFVDSWRHAVWGGRDEIVGFASASVWNTGTNAHLAEFHLGVLPEFRRRGLARQLLRPIVEGAQARGRRLLIAETCSRVPAAAAFMQSLGARSGLTERISQLDVRDMDRAMVRGWIERAEERARGFTLGLWEGPYPEESYAEIAAMLEAENLMPRGEIEAEDERHTPERVRQQEAARRQRRDERWSLHVRDPESGRIGGWTEVFWHPESPEVMWQGGTAVFREFQNRGLGRWLKAVMMEKILSERPQVRWIRTGNAHVNAPMLKINVELGFKPYLDQVYWQVETDRAAEYLAAR